MKDYYSILGVNQKADAGEIKRVYRKLAVKYHPDKNPDPSVEHLFKEINEAYDTLSDPTKRFFYDQQFRVYQEPEQPPLQRPHRDPAYRRKTPSNYKPVYRATVKDLMTENVNYVKWMTYAAFLITSIWVLDFMLPYNIQEEQVIDVYTVEAMRGRSNALYYQYDLIFTGSGKTIRVYNQNARYFDDEISLRLASTAILSTHMQLINNTYTTSVQLGYIYYSGIALVPFALFIISGFGILFRHKKEFLFNTSIACGVLNVIVLYFMFTI
jgi:curved DNA-binding protein CbpA